MPLNFIRDSRSPIPKNPIVSRVMGANKAKDTKLELKIQKALRSLKIKSYKLHPSNIPGRPDIVFLKKKLAIFLHGCFWHRCPKCDLTLPKTNRAFWKKKFTRNQERDKRKLRELKRAGWKTLVIWEHEIKKDPARATQRVLKLLRSSQ
ncbi:MAG: mismatch (G:T) repair endonuclease protein [Candidatus Woesebacteria bacterium GW2011_GWB1_39_10]|uniref:Mismatch (G:T) repair endonuclease protein n=1 Tax=Candidatus Woesebacteria bacterium GW2011_GWB1_39_10 TaxID=1618572 RepID=A0A0G0NZK9_9BACT|nr:MAG: mismatch (G:T) repair endonuclease protein [Candidatus Woesebacteria bacterium GW2011_GWB1_39_10]